MWKKNQNLEQCYWVRVHFVKYSVTIWMEEGFKLQQIMDLQKDLWGLNNPGGR